MALPTRRNLGDLRQELRDRLGLGSQGAESGPSTRIMNSFLRNAQVQLYLHYDWNELVTTTEFATGVGQINYTWPDNCDPDSIISVVLIDTVMTTANRYRLREGITHIHDEHSVPNDQPRRFERRAQLEIWPPPDRTTYNIELEYPARLGRFSIDQDLATIDEDIILLHAIANAKAHYQHPDAQTYASQLEVMLGKLKGRETGSEKISRSGYRGRNSYGRFSDLEDYDYYYGTRHLDTRDI